MTTRLPPVDYDKLVNYRWKVWTAAGGWWGQVSIGRLPIGGPFKTEAKAHEWVLSFERMAERDEGKE